MISALSFLFNEEQNLENCLKSIQNYVDEIIIFDLESTDRTYEIARNFTDKVYKKPYLLCGDSYKNELLNHCKGDWVLWFYGDETFNPKAADALRKVCKSDKWTAFAFMRHEYMDGIRLNFLKDNKKIEYGSVSCPNYQIRLLKNDGKIYYTELVHAELHGEYRTCSLPPEYYIEHHKTSNGQELDNIRLYIYYKYLTWKYGNTEVGEYKRYMESYHKIIADSEALNLQGRRFIHMAEEFWWDWREYAHEKRITLEEFKQRTGIPYEEWVNSRKFNLTIKEFQVVDEVVDKSVIESKKEDEKV